MTQEFKAPLAYFAGLAMSQRLDMVRVRENPGRHSPVGVLHSSQAPSGRTLRRAKAELDMNASFAIIDPQQPQSVQDSAFKHANDVRESNDLAEIAMPFPALDLVFQGSLVDSSWIHKSSRYAKLDDQSVISDGKFSTISTVPSLTASTTSSIRSLATGIATPISRENFDELSMYVALSHGIEDAIRLSTSPHLPTPISNSETKFHQHLPPILCLPNLFRSIGICDPKIKGNPTYLRSKYFSIGPRGLRVARCEFLNLPPGQDVDDFTLSCRPGADSRPQFVLEYATGLVSLESGLKTWVLAAQMDFTDVIIELTAHTIKCNGDSLGHGAVGFGKNRASTESLDLDDFPAPPNHEINWTSIACSPEPSSTTPLDLINIPASSLPTLHSLLHRIRTLHRACFTLTQSATKAVWQISWTSATIFNTLDDVHVGVSRTDARTLRMLEEALGSEEPRPTRVEIRWGVEGVRRGLLCVPMFRNKCEAWMCFLIDEVDMV